MNEIRSAFRRNLLDENQVLRQILGICSILAVTNLLINTLVMGLGLMFVVSLSSLTISALRSHIPHRVRMIIQIFIIAAYVIFVDITIKAFSPDISRALGPYVGLIITNCIIMGRAEAFAQSNPPIISFWDGMTSGAGYMGVLMVIAFFRELFGFGTLFGFRVMPGWFPDWTIMVMPPSAFFFLGLIIWIGKNIMNREAA